jgi:N-acyl homoserine lactone hydrolase
MTTYRIRPIALCEGPRDVSQWTHRLNIGTKCNSAIYVWYIEGSQPKILVDSGVTASYYAGKPFITRDLISVEDGLRKLGLTPEDIKIVIITHLHFDHVSLAYLYKKAKFIVQKRELDYARNPHPIDALFYDSSAFEGLNFEVIDGDKEIIPGVSVLLTPGHTPGGQSVEIETIAGKAIITGFCSQMSTFTQTEEMRQMGWEVAAPGLHQDVREAYDSVLKVKRRASIIIPLHDPAFITKEVIP